MMISSIILSQPKGATGNSQLFHIDGFFEDFAHITLILELTTVVDMLK